MPGKDPHRPEGKTLDAEHQNLHRRQRNALRSPNEGAGAPPPSRYPAEEQIGGSRPGVPSLVKDAILARDDDA